MPYTEFYVFTQLSYGTFTLFSTTKMYLLGKYEYIKL